MKTFSPNQAVIPILKTDASQTITAILGTSFYTRINDRLYLITARHVLEDNPLGDGESYVYAFENKSGVNLAMVTGFHYAKNSDVAIFEAAENDMAVAIPFSTTGPPFNRDIICYEYSQTRVEAKPAGGVHVTMEPFAHKGNVMRYYDADFPSYVNAPCFVTSFPAMLGASGAPIISETDKKQFCIVGMVVANMGRHLMPAQVEKISDAAGYSEETAFYLPLGMALQSSVVVEAASEIGNVEII